MCLCAHTSVHHTCPEVREQLLGVFYLVEVGLLLLILRYHRLQATSPVGFQGVLSPLSILRLKEWDSQIAHCLSLCLYHLAGPHGVAFCTCVSA